MKDILRKTVNVAVLGGVILGIYYLAGRRLGKREAALIVHTPRRLSADEYLQEYVDSEFFKMERAFDKET